MYLLISTEYSFLAGCLEDKPKSQISESFAPISAFIITWIREIRSRGDGEMAIGASGSNQTAGILKHQNYVIYLVSKVWYESPAYQLSNAPTLEKIR
jgi:hypothetical protein